MQTALRYAEQETEQFGLEKGQILAWILILSWVGTNDNTLHYQYFISNYKGSKNYLEILSQITNSEALLQHFEGPGISKLVINPKYKFWGNGCGSVRTHAYMF